jgi:hypothetical protein
MVCAGFMHLQFPEVDTDTVFNKEGTAAGEYFEKKLLGEEIPVIANNGVHIDDDMKFYIDPIVQDVMSRNAVDSAILCEVKINWQTQVGVWIKGRPDVSFVDHEGTLCVEDLKYGFGIVEVEENWQLIGYAIGEVIRRGRAFDKISLTIHQPRAHHEDGSSRTWVITYQQLCDYKKQIEDRMNEIVNGNKELTTSKHCKYCPGAAEACPAFNRLFHRALEVSTDFHQDSINNDELSKQLDHIKRAEEVLKIKQDSLVELATMRIKQGGIIPGYVQTQRFSNRKWKSGVTPEAIKLMTGKDITERTIMTPGKAQKAGVHKDLINQLAEKHFIGVKLEKKSAKELADNVFGKEEPKMEVVNV